jgi:hypothetical protein
MTDEEFRRETWRHLLALLHTLAKKWGFKPPHIT